MADTHTQKTTDYFFDILNDDIAQVWEDITSTPEDTPAGTWKNKLERIAEDYSLSSRFALMRLLWARAQDSREEALLEVPAAGAEFTAAIHGTPYVFRNVTLAHARDLPPEEHQKYLDLLTQIAADRPDSDCDRDTELIYRAWKDEDAAKALLYSHLPEMRPKTLRSARAVIKAAVKSAFQNSFSRSDALKLGHVLGFSYQEMQWYLLRVFDTGDCFRFNDSDDLIDAYGFLTGCGWQKVQQLKEAYAEKTDNALEEEPEGRDENWTQNVTGTFFEKVSRWQEDPETSDRKFLDWLLIQAPGLDQPSRTAARIYRNLAVYAQALIKNRNLCPAEEDFTDCIQNLCRSGLETGDVRDLLYVDNKLSADRCKKLASALLDANWDLVGSDKTDHLKSWYLSDKTHVWHVLTTDDKGKPTGSGGLINSSRTRVLDVLTNRVQAEKGDLLYLLWLTANIIWQKHDYINIDTPTDTEDLGWRLTDFMESSRILLKAALLPEFYPPHPMEQAMLLSIVCYGQDDLDIAAVHDAMLLSLIGKRNRKSGVKHKTREERAAIVQYFLDHEGELTFAKCAAQFGIDDYTLSCWVKKHLEQTEQNALRA